MFRTLIRAALASTALAAAPVLAAPGGIAGAPVGLPGGGAGANVGVGAGSNMGVGLGSMNPNAGAGVGLGAQGTLNSPALDAHTQGRLNSQGSLHASPTGIAHASVNSVLKNNVVVSGPLTGLTSGMTVNFNGAAVGTVQRVIASSDGTVRRVMVVGTNGRLVSLSPTTLTLSGGVLTTTSFRG